MKKTLFLLDPAPNEGGNGGTGGKTQQQPPKSEDQGGGGQQNPQVPAGYISVADSNSRIESARQQEKDKLYGEINNLKSLIAERDAAIAQLNGEKQALTSQLEALKNATSSDGKQVDVQKLIGEVVSRTEATLKKTYESQIEKLQQDVQGTSSNLARMRLERFRENEVRKAGGEGALIPELVKGNSEQEILESISESKRVFDGIKGRFAPTTQKGGDGSQQRRDSQGFVPPVIPSLPAGQPAAGDGVVTVREMPLSEYKAKRAQILQSTAARYQGQ